MLSILRQNMNMNANMNMNNIFNLKIDPVINLIKSDSLLFKFEFKKEIPWEYNIIISNLEIISDIKEYTKFYFDKNFIIQENYNILGFTYTTSLYRQIIGLNRDKSFNDLKTFLIIIEKFIKKCSFIRFIEWNNFSYQRINNIYFKFKESKKGLEKLKITYNDDKKTILNIDYLIKKIDNLIFT